jgi:multidrug efflux system membrane fusion protein
MARYGRADRRIQRILYGVGLSRGITRWGVAAIAAIVLPLSYIAATVRASQAAPQLPAPPAAPRPPAAAAPPVVVQAPRSPRGSLIGLGTVTATTLMVRSKLDGELKSLGFEEGKPVQAGQLLATVDAQDTQSLLDRARSELDAARQRLALEPTNMAKKAQMEAAQRDVENLERVKAFGQIRAPFAGVAGLRKVDPGNLLHTGDLIVVITQLQPISVLFSIPEDALPLVMARLRAGAAPTVEAWNRDNSARLTTGTLTAADNEIDKSTGMATLRATFENHDEALFPNQFVNVHLLLSGR